MSDRAITARRAPSVVVACVDSLLQDELTDFYLAERRLLTPMNSNGFAAGEAGSAVLIEAAGGGAARELQVLGMELERCRVNAGSTPPRPVYCKACTQHNRPAESKHLASIQ